MSTFLLYMGMGKYTVYFLLRAVNKISFLMWPSVFTVKKKWQQRLSYLPFLELTMIYMIWICMKDTSFLCLSICLEHSNAG